MTEIVTDQLHASRFIWGLTYLSLDLLGLQHLQFECLSPYLENTKLTHFFNGNLDLTSSISAYYLINFCQISLSETFSCISNCCLLMNLKPWNFFCQTNSCDKLFYLYCVHCFCCCVKHTMRHICFYVSWLNSMIFNKNVLQIDL